MASKAIIGFLDVLGFAELVKRRNFNELFDAYTNLIQSSLSARRHYSMDYVVFSDTIVIISEKTDYEGLLDLLEAISVFSFKALVELELPIKGSVSSGDISYDKKDKDIVIAGTPIVEAYKFEQIQNWIGVMVSPNTVREYPELPTKCEIGNFHIPGQLQNFKDNIRWSLCAQKTYQIPMKGSDDDENFQGYALVPHELSSIDASHIIEDLKIYKEQLSKLALYSANPSIQKKYQNTGRFIDDMVKTWKRLESTNVYREAIWKNNTPPDRVN